MNMWPFESKETGLLKAAKCGDLDTCKSMIERGANVNARGKDGKTALTLAAESFHKEIMLLLMSSGADAFESLKQMSGRDDE
jgi:ankyrin repeat protein